jgi:hypothetical protein
LTSSDGANPDPGVALALLASPAASAFRLRVLELFEMPLAGRLGEFLRLEPTHRLRELRLAWTGVGDADLADLLRGRRAEHLRGLNLGYTHVTLAGLEALAASPLFPRLAFLYLEGLSFEPGSEGRLASLFSASRLRSLRLATPYPREPAADLVALDGLLSAPGWGELRSLVLFEFPLAPGRWERLAAHPGLPALEELEVEETGLDAAGLEALAAAPFDNLRRLTLALNSEPRVEGAAWGRLLAAGWFSGLLDLRVAGRSLPPDLFANLPAMPRLRRLRLPDASLDGAGLRQLAESGRFPALTALEVGVRLAGEGDALAALTDSPQLPHLTHLAVDGRPADSPGEAALRALINSSRGLSLALPFAWTREPALRQAYQDRYGRVRWPECLDLRLAPPPFGEED